MHAVQYQLNEGPGADTSHYRLTVTIYDANQNEISTANDTVVESPQGAWTAFYSKLPSTLNVQTGAVDSDPLWFEYPGQGDWQTGDQQHYCNFGAYSDRSRSGNCGYTCS